MHGWVVTPFLERKRARRASFLWEEVKGSFYSNVVTNRHCCSAPLLGAHFHLLLLHYLSDTYSLQGLGS